MTVYLVGAGPGDPKLITVRGAEVLGAADVVLYDRLSEASLLDLVPAAAERISVGKTPRGPSTPQEEINRLLVEKGRSGLEVVRLKGGDAFVFSRGGEEAAALAAAGVVFEVVPGISSAIAAPAYAGIPVTHRGLSTSFTVVTGHEAPWASTDTDWEAVARVGGTIVVLMGVATRAAISERLQAGGLPPDTPVAAITWGTRPEQRTVRTTLDRLGAAAVEHPAVIVIGAVAALDLRWFESRPLFGRRIAVTGGNVAFRLRELGAEVIETPAIEIVDGDVEALQASATAVRDYDWLLFTSANAIVRFMPLLRDMRALGGVHVAAIGPGTAEALAAWHVVPDVVPTEAVAESLLDALAEQPVPQRALLPRAAAARDVLPDGLRARGWTVDVVDAYRTLPAAPRPVAADAITFLSSSAVDAYVDVNGTDVPPLVACIGPVTAATARARGLTVDFVADPHTADGLVDGLLAHLGS